MEIKKEGNARLSRFKDYIEWYSGLHGKEMQSIGNQMDSERQKINGFPDDIRKAIDSAIENSFDLDTWYSRFTVRTEEEKARELENLCKKKKAAALPLLKRFSGVCETYAQLPKVGLWVDGVFAFLYFGNPTQGIIVYEPEKWLEYVPLPDFSDTSPAQMLAAANVSELPSATALIPADAAGLTPNQLNDLAHKNSSALSDLEKQIKAVKNAETGELAEIQKIIQEQQALLEKKQKEMMAELEKKKAEMEEAKERLEGQIWMLESQIYAIQCYTGETISFARIRSGKNAPDTEPVIIHQKLRFLDEDLGRLTSIYRIRWDDIRFFEDFLKYSPIALDAFAPNERCITLCRVSKDAKSFARSQMFPYSNVLDDYEYYHGKTVGIIIRNGENLYLGWTDDERVHIQDDLIRSKANPFDLTFLARPEEFTSEYAERQWEKERKEKTKQTMDDIVSRVFVMNILQGVIERTDMLPLPKGERVAQKSKYVQFSLSDLWLTDNRFGSFTDIVKRCNSHVTRGDTILTTQSLWPQRNSWGITLRNDRGRGYANRTHDCSVEDCTLYKINLIETEERDRYYVSVEKDTSIVGARSNFEVYPEEFINLTYMNSVWLEWVINSKTLGGWKVGGCAVNYAYAIRYLNTALDYVRDREVREKAFIDSVDPEVCKTAEWQVKLSEWKIEKSVREMNEYQAKRFCKFMTGLKSVEN